MIDLEKVESQRAGDFYFRGEHPSGLRICLYPRQNSGSTRAILGTKYGSIDNCFQCGGESHPQTVPVGAAHYLEHKLFESAEGDAFSRFAEIGANANAYTGYESTCYVFSCTDMLYEALDILLGFVQSPYFTQETLAKERGIIEQEIKMYEDMPGWQVMLNYLRAMYHVHPVREDPAGTLESVGEITPSHLYRCYRTFYHMGNMVLVLAGQFDVDRVLDVCNRKLKPAPPMQLRRLFPSEPEGVVKPFVESRLSVAMPLFQFGYKAGGSEGKTEADLAAVSVLLSVMASDASPMFRRLLEQELINESSFGYQYLEGRGFATIIFGGESKDPESAASVIRQETARMKREGISPQAFQWAKRSLYGDCIASLNSAAGIADWVADFALQGLEVFTYIDALANLTLEQAAGKLSMFHDDRTVLSVVRPI